MGSFPESCRSGRPITVCSSEALTRMQFFDPFCEPPVSGIECFSGAEAFGQFESLRLYVNPDDLFGKGMAQTLHHHQAPPVPCLNGTAPRRRCRNRRPATAPRRVPGPRLGDRQSPGHHQLCTECRLSSYYSSDSRPMPCLSQSGLCRCTDADCQMANYIL
jgi:hypothetical protein